MAVMNTKTTNRKSKPAAKAATKVTDSRSRQEKSRLNFRLAPEIKARVVRAASLAGQDLTEFAVAALSEKASEVIEQHDHLLLSSDDYNFFLNTLDAQDVSEPSERASAFADKYRRGTRKGVRYRFAD